MWGGDDAEATEKVHDFFKTKHFLNIPVVPGAKEAMLQLRAMGFDLVVVTSRQLAIQDATRKWLNRHFPSDLFREVAFGNHWGLEGRKIRKVDLCRELQASVLIDDSLTYVREVADAGMKAILFDLDGTYGWNKSDELPEGVTRLQDWEQVIDHLRRL